MRRPLLTAKQILEWVDAHFAACQQWPNRKSGRIPCSLGETWSAIEQALIKRHRGLSKKSSLAQFLFEHRGVRNRMRLPRLTEELILTWADEHHDRTGEWPTMNSGQVHGVLGETWSGIDSVLRGGSRGLKRKSSIAKLLYSSRGVWSAYNMPRLTERLILQWAKAHYGKTGSWPTRESGMVQDAPEETWDRINNSLIQGDRGLAGGKSLANLLDEKAGVRNRKALPKLTIINILCWADAYVAEHGRWPTHLSGPIPNSGGETWSGVHAALSYGQRGFSGGSSLYRILKEYRGVPRYRPKGQFTLSA